MGFAVGQTVGPYQIIEQLGQGGMATVYKGYHASLDRNVAIKVMHTAFGEDKTFLERFKREAQLVARLEHQNIVPVYDFAEFQNQPYLVMKFIEGITLKDRLRKGVLNVSEIIYIMSAVANALDYAHQRDILHRDVKPSNVMIDITGTPYLTDFGLARLASSGESTLSVDVMVGTPHYISPEQARGGIKLDARTDIYSLGIVLYQLVVGRVPFTGDTPFNIVHDHIYKALPPPSLMNPSVPMAVEQVLLKALAKEPASRYQNAGEMIRAFKQATEIVDISEMSASSLRRDLDDFIVVDVPATPPAPPTPPSSPSPVATTTPPPYATQMQPMVQQVPSAVTPAPSFMIPGSSTIQRRKRAARTRFWVFNGFAIFLCSALIATVLVANALSDSRIQEEQIPTNANTEVFAAVDVPVDFVDGVGESMSKDDILAQVMQEELTVAEAEEIVAQNPQEPLAYLALSLAYLQAGDEDRSEEILIGTFLLFEPDTETLLAATQVLLDRGMNDVAMYFYLLALATDPENMALRNETGAYLYSQATAEDPNIDAFCELLLEFPESPLAQIFLVQALVTTNENPRTAQIPAECGPAFPRNMTLEQVLQQAMQAPPADEGENTPSPVRLPEGALVLANYQEKGGDLEEATRLWENLAVPRENTPEWVQHVAQEKLAINAASAPEGLSFVELAMSDMTIEEAQEMVAANPDDPAAHFLEAFAHLRAGNHDQAAEIFKQTIENLEVESTLLMDAARVTVQLGFDAEAITLYTVAMFREPTNVEIREEAGEYLYVQASNASRTEATQFCNLEAQFPAFALLDVMLAQAVISSAVTPRRMQVPLGCPQPRGTNALSLLQDALADFENMPEGHLVLGNYYEAIGDNERAVEEWTLLEERNDTPEWVKNRARDKLRVNE